MSNVMDERIKDLGEFVQKHVAGENAQQYHDNPERYMDEVLIPYNMCVIELLTGTECMKKKNDITFKSVRKRPTTEELSRIIMLITDWEIGNMKHFKNLVKAVQEADTLGAMPIVPEVTKPISQKDFDNLVKSALKRVISIADLMAFVNIGIQKEAYEMRKKMYIGLGVATLGITVLGYMWWKNRKDDIVYSEEFKDAYDESDSDPDEVPVSVEAVEE